MDYIKLMKERHSVRNYLDKPIEKEKVDLLKEEIEKINSESGMRFQLFTDEPKAFNGNETKYGKFTNCKNYFALVGRKGRDEEIGYYGEKLVLFAQGLGLNTCWVALTYRKGQVVIDKEEDEKLYVVISLGYGANQGVEHIGKDVPDVCNMKRDFPDWFRTGVEGALTAPTAINQQKFYFTYLGDSNVKADYGLGFYAKMDLGIAKLHFELAVGDEVEVIWK
ncbi:MAG: nitroreductase [Clostridia bacterium]|nr:nitroreductase [Clostridia bacterium]